MKRKEEGGREGGIGKQNSLAFCPLTCSTYSTTQPSSGMTFVNGVANDILLLGSKSRVC